MWDTDHFVTQVNPEPGPAGPRGISTDGMACAKAHNCRDFVDYDSNVIAVAHGVGGAEKGKKALARIVRRISPSPLCCALCRIPTGTSTMIDIPSWSRVHLSAS